MSWDPFGNVGTNKAPITTPGISHFTTNISTLPSLRWLRAEEPDVTMMLARDVASAMCMLISGEMPAQGSKNNNAGTTINPPPMPSSPAITPTKAPSASNNKNKETVTITYFFPARTKPAKPCWIKKSCII